MLTDKWWRTNLVKLTTIWLRWLQLLFYLFYFCLLIIKNKLPCFHKQCTLEWNQVNWFILENPPMNSSWWRSSDGDVRVSVTVAESTRSERRPSAMTAWTECQRLSHRQNSHDWDSSVCTSRGSTTRHTSCQHRNPHSRVRLAKLWKVLWTIAGLTDKVKVSRPTQNTN